MIARLRQAIALLLVIGALVLTGCGGDRDVPIVLLEGDDMAASTNPLVGAIAEVSPPERIQQLKPYLDVYEPQVRIATPRDGTTLTDTTVSVELQVRDFPIYKDQDLELGPHLHLFLDDQPYRAVYSADMPVVFENLAPGTHTLRVFASRPWHESFKNEGAYDQVTFNVFAPSPNYNPDNSQALLTYSRPQGSYGAEPIMLDFYLRNAPLHIVAAEDESILDWRLRCTVNGESFVFDRWQPIYLKGFKPGQNWVKLELIDENGNLINNAFNTGIRVIDYNPGGEDGLAKLVRGDIPLSQAKVLVDPNYEPPARVVKEEPTPSVSEETGTSQEVPTPAESSTEKIPAEPETTVEKSPAEEVPAEELAPVEPETPVEGATPDQTTPTLTPLPAEPKQTAPMPLPEPTAEPGMLPEIVEEPEQPEISEPEASPPAPEPLPNPNETSQPDSSNDVQLPAGADESPSAVPNTIEEFAPPSEPEASPVPETTPNTLESKKQKRQRLRFNRDRLQPPAPAAPDNEADAIPPAPPRPPVIPPALGTEAPAESDQPTTPEADEAPAEPMPPAEANVKSPSESDNVPEADEPSLESLEETSDVI